MGQLNTFILEPLIEKYNLKVYFETGTGEAISLRHALKSNFEHFYTVDIDGEFIENAKKIITNTNLTYIHNYSTKALEEYVPTLDKNKPVLFFLDAHFPGADFHKCSYEESIKTFKEESFPLHLEIENIKKNRDTSKDVIIIDDFKLYEPSDLYEHSVNPVKKYLDAENLSKDSSFIYKAFESTHVFEKNYKHQGYLSILPKS